MRVGLVLNPDLSRARLASLQLAKMADAASVPLPPRCTAASWRPTTACTPRLCGCGLPPSLCCLEFLHDLVKAIIALFIYSYMGNKVPCVKHSLRRLMHHFSLSLHRKHDHCCRPPPDVVPQAPILDRMFQAFQRSCGTRNMRNRPDQ